MRLYNTQSGDFEELTTHDGSLGIYVCGITPYDTTHMGHAFTFLTFDILIRYLRYNGYVVTYVQNVTDIDDDILRKAHELGMAWDELARSETNKFLNDMRNLNALYPDHYVLATDHIAEIIVLNQLLLKQGNAYESEGCVYFSVASDPEFGKLSHIPASEMLAIANERGNDPDDSRKRDPLDFVLWQASAAGEPSWPSPWGQGRPGWHIECSAMATRYLGSTVDIHGGGIDLVFPHHECEIAQTENAMGIKPFVRYWMHVGMVEYEGEKMSKSLGNLVLASRILENYNSDAVRLYLFSHHYRATWEYIDEEIEIAVELADLLAEALALPSFGVEEIVDVSLLRQRFFHAMDDDLDTPAAIQVLRKIGDAILQAEEEDDVSEAQASLQTLGGILGLTMGIS